MVGACGMSQNSPQGRNMRPGAAEAKESRAVLMPKVSFWFAGIPAFPQR